MLLFQYRYTTQVVEMDLRTHPHLQAVEHVADAILAYDDPDFLLIVYYTGHGRATSDGRLLMHGTRENDGDGREMYIDWTEVEATLGKAKSDVLVILDCCYAGILQPDSHPARSTRRKFQYITACKGDQFTKSAGKDSFSRAMLEALDILKTQQKFTTSELVRTLTAHEDFPREDQEALVFDSRFGSADEDIWLVPWTVQASRAFSAEEFRKQHNDLPTVDFLDLRFRFGKHATDSDIEATAEGLKKLIWSAPDLKFHRISFLRRKLHATDVIRHWRDVVSKNRDAVEVATKTSRGYFASGLEEEPTRSSNAGLLSHVGRLASILFAGCGTVPAWHETSFIVPW